MATQQNITIQPIPESLSHLIHLNQKYGVLICLGHGCQSAVSPATISSHLRRKHRIQLELRRQVDRYIEQSPLEYNYSNVQLPIDGLAPQPIVKVVDGGRCKDCTFISQSRKAIKEHGNKKHDKKRIADKDLFIPVRLQSWFWGGKERYWVVDESQPPEVERGLGQGSREEDASFRQEEDSQDDVDNQLVQEIRRNQAHLKEQRLVLLNKVPVVELDPWLRFTGWNEVLCRSKHNIRATYQFAHDPDADEPGLQRLLVAWRRILDRCLNTLEAMDHMDTLKWWASPKNEAASVHPFELPQNSQTMVKYSYQWQRFLCYAMRTAPYSYFNDETETGVAFNEVQWDCIQQIRNILRTSISEDEYTEVEEQDQELTSELMRFCTTIVMQDTSKHQTIYQSPLMHYLAIMGVDVQSGQFRGSFTYTPILAGVLYINRLIMLEMAVSQQGWPRLDIPAKEDIPSIPTRIRQIRVKHLCEGSFSPTSSILSQLAMGKSFNKLHEVPSNIHWSEDEQTIFYLGQPVLLNKIQIMCYELIQEIQALLHVLAFEEALPAIDLSTIIDSMAWSFKFRQDDYSFLKHPSNKALNLGFEYGLKRARKAGMEWQMFQAKENNQLEWIDHRASAYLTIERQFLQKLIVYCHITGGQPARGPELGSTKVCNSVYSARGWYVMNGRLCFITTYDKTRKRRGNTQHIVRYLPDEGSQILAQYLVYVRPFARVVEYETTRSLTNPEYLFRDARGPWAGEELTRALAKSTMKHLGVRLTVQGWRHVAIGIAMRHLIRDRKIWDKEEEGDEEGNFADGDDEEELKEATFQHIIIRQAGHGARVAKGHYAVDGAYLHRLGPELLSAFERASIAWHLLVCKVKSCGSQVESKEKHRREASRQLQPEKVQRIKIEGELSIESLAMRRAMRGLQAIYGPNARPQSQDQADALAFVHRVYKPTDTAIVVLPTGSGKTALFFSIAAITDQQTVIVVVPFVALVDDVMARAGEAGLNCKEWRDENSEGESQQLIVVSADRAVQGEFLHFARGLQLNQRLAYIFFDECHVAFTDTSYRARLRELWMLRYLDCPFICLTATLMVVLERKLRDQLLIPAAIMFRRSTARRTIRYTVQDSRDEAPSVVGIRLIQGLILPSGKRGVVYVRSYRTGEVISSELKCAFYKAHAESKSQLLQNWINGSGGWIVATGALGTGINISGIIYVVHIDRPYGLTSFVQQSGRGGRDGEVSDSIIVVRVQTTSGRRRSEILNEYSVEKVDEDAMTEYIQASQCRRQVLARHMDGVEEGGSCNQTDSVFCDLCQTTTRTTRVTADESREEDSCGSQAISAQLITMAEADEVLFRAMDRLKRHCLYCELIGVDGGQGIHQYSECRAAQSEECGYDGYLAWRADVTFGEGKHCWKCGLSQEVCRGLERRAGCEYLNIMMPSIYILDREGHLRGTAEIVGFHGTYPDDFGEWISGVSDEFGRAQESNWMRVWRESCRLYLMMKGEL